MTEKIEPKVLNSTDVLRIVHGIVTEQGAGYRYLDHYDDCQNFTDDDPTEGQCIVGRVFASQGLTEEDCGQADVHSSIRHLVQKGSPVEFTKKAQTVLSLMQAIQDLGGTWGLAYNVARQEAITWNSQFPTGEQTTHDAPFGIAGEQYGIPEGYEKVEK